MRTMMKSKATAILTLTLFVGVGLAGCVEEGGNGGGGGGDGANVLTTCGNDALATARDAMNDDGGDDNGTGNLSIPEARSLLMANAAAVQQSLGELSIGSLMPITGTLSAYGGDMRDAVDLAVADLNRAAQGLATVTHVAEDSASSDTEAPNAMNRLIAQDVSGIVGAAGSGVTASILSAAIQNEIVVVTPASTSPALTRERDNQGYFFRVPPSDALQGQVLAQLVYDDGCRTVAIAAVDNPYGQGLAGQFSDTFESLGGTVSGNAVMFAPDTNTFSSEIETLSQRDSDAIVFIGYPGEGVPFMTEAFEDGLTSEAVFFFSEGVMDAAGFAQAVPEHEGSPILAGLGGTTPRSVETERARTFVQKFNDEYGNEPGLFAAESYDATIAIALAAVSAQSTSGAVIKDHMLNVWNAPGQKTSDITEALALLATGTDIDWQGISTDFDWDENGDPVDGNYSYWIVEDDGTIATADVPA